MPSQIGQRLAFTNAANAVKRAGLNPGGAVLSQSYLRLEVNAVASTTSYKFDVLTNETATTPTTGNTTQKLNLQDAFVCNQIGFFLGVPGAGAATYNEYRPLTYPAIGLASGALGNFTPAQALNALSFYNGFFSLTINQRTVITAWDLMRHYRPTVTQMNTVTSPATPGTLTTSLHVPSEDSVDMSNDGMFPTEPNIVFAGNKKHDFNISLPIGIGGTLPTNGVRIIAILRGILAQNVTAIN
jgi:hypothetical protein